MEEPAVLTDGMGSETRRVLVLYCGGTFGMVWNEAKDDYDWLTLEQLQKKLKTYPTLCDHNHTITSPSVFEPLQAIALPYIKDYKCRVIYCIDEYNAIDSANMNMNDWVKLAKHIGTYYKKFHGFVLLHGTDTLCYTASALSFMLKNLGKPVILTGAQLPLTETRSDAHGNMLGSLLMAGSGFAHIPEVCIYFDHQLFRGNRTTKTSSTSFTPYSSPSIPPLVTLGMNVTIASELIRCPDPKEKFTLHPNMCPDVATLTIFPGMTPQLVEKFLEPPLKGVILQTYGAGHYPTLQPLLEKVAEACKRGVVVVNCSQCSHGTTHTASKDLQEMGVVTGADLTIEAALTKLSYLLGCQDLTIDQIKKNMGMNLCGEMTPI